MKAKKIGQGRNRTADTGIFSPLLYRLSYLTVKTKTHIKSDMKKSTIKFHILLIFFVLCSFTAYAEDSWQYYYRKGTIEFNNEMYDFAVENLSRALEQNGSLYQAANLIAEIYMRNNMKKKALDYYVKSLSIDPSQYIIHNKAGSLYWFYLEIDSAYYHFQKAIQLKQDYIPAHINMVRYHVFKKNSQKAEEHFNTSFRLGKSKSDPLIKEAMLAHQQGNLQKAIAKYREAIDVNPAARNAYYQLADLYRQEKKVTEAIHILETLLDVKPDDEKSLVTLAHLYFTSQPRQNRKRKLELALRYLERAVSINPANETSWLLMHDIHSFMGNDIEAAEALRRAQQTSQQKP